MTDPGIADCIFCRIARGELGTELVAESEHNVAFRDLHPQAPVHVLIVPRRHFSALREVNSDDWDVTADALALASRVAAAQGVLRPRTYDPAILTFGSVPPRFTSDHVRGCSPRMTAAASRIELTIDW